MLGDMTVYAHYNIKGLFIQEIVWLYAIKVQTFSFIVLVKIYFLDLRHNNVLQ